MLPRDVHEQSCTARVCVALLVRAWWTGLRFIVAQHRTPPDILYAPARKRTTAPCRRVATPGARRHVRHRTLARTTFAAFAPPPTQPISGNSAKQKNKFGNTFSLDRVFRKTEHVARKVSPRGWESSACLPGVVGGVLVRFQELWTVTPKLRTARSGSMSITTQHFSAWFSRNFCGTVQRCWNSPGTLPTASAGLPNSARLLGELSGKPFRNTSSRCFPTLSELC